VSLAKEAGILTRPSGLVLRAVAALAALAYLFAPEHLDESFAPLIKALPIWVLAYLAFLAKDIPRHNRLALALTLSGVGDLLLSLDFANGFAFGMGAFLLAQLSYMACFLPRRRIVAALSWQDKAVIIGVVVWAVGLGIWLLPLAGPLAPALMVYFGALCLMVLLALGSDAPRIAKIGALLFLLSDSLIGIDRFVSPLPEPHLAVMTSYYLAQALLFWGLMQTLPSDDAVANP
jgi:uncharacterized membrane protein YhhN